MKWGRLRNPSEDLTIFDELNELGRRQPFEPYTIVMASGSRYEVRENDHVAVGSSFIIFYRGRGEQHLLRSSRVSEVSIVETEP